MHNKRKMNAVDKTKLAFRGLTAKAIDSFEGNTSIEKKLETSRDMKIGSYTDKKLSPYQYSIGKTIELDTKEINPSTLKEISTKYYEFYEDHTKAKPNQVKENESQVKENASQNNAPTANQVKENASQNNDKLKPIKSKYDVFNVVGKPVSVIYNTTTSKPICEIEKKII